MVVVNGKSPEVNSVAPKRILARELAQTIWVRGSGFTASSAVTIDGTAMGSVTFVSSEELKCELPSGPSLEAGTYNLVVSNGNYDSKNFPVTLEPTTPFNGTDYQNPTVNQKAQPLDASFKGRRDIQRVLAGNDFTGVLPDVHPQGRPGDVAGPTDGGLFTFNERVLINQFEFQTVGGAEGVARGAGSGVFLVRKDSSPSLLVTLANTNQYVIFTDNLILNKGDAIKFVTNGATLEMFVSVSHAVSNRRFT